MKYCLTILALLVSLAGATAQNQTPVISGFTLQTDIPNNAATLQYTLSDAENDALEVTVQFSTDGGRTYTSLSGGNVSGDVGFPVSPGARSATCTGLNFIAPGSYSFRVIADDRQVFDIQALVDQVDSNRLRNDLAFVEGIRHRTTGLAHLNETRDSIQRLFETAGLFFEKQTFTSGSATGQNLIGSLAGTVSGEKVLIVDAHYDSDNDAPGADDNGSGTVGMMEIARVLSKYPSKKSQRYIGFDLEEAGLLGSIRYNASGIPATEQIEGVYNFEMIGYWSDQPNTQTFPPGFSFLFPTQAQTVANNQNRGDFITNIGNNNSQSLGTHFSAAAAQYVPDLKVIALNVPTPVPSDFQRSDHYPFWQKNRKALLLTDGAEFRNPCYHEACDTLGNLNFTFMANVVKATLASMAQLVEVQHADWAAAAFDLQVGTSVPALCGFKFLQNSLTLQADECFDEEVSLEFYDLKGVLLSRQSLRVPGGGAIALPTANLPAGVYALKIRHGKGIFSQKVIIP